MGLVCRHILMYNEYVPAIVGHRDWRYQVLGHHDGMDVCTPIYLDTSESFQQLYDTYIERDRSMDYASQSYFGLHEDDGREEEFWDDQYIFTFVSFIQYREKAISAYHRYLENEIYSQGGEDRSERKLSVRAYYTMDHNDSILVIKCNRYDVGVELVNSMHHDGAYPFEIRNGYSILAFERDSLCQDILIRQPQEIIHKVELRVVESCQGSITDLYDRLKQQFTPDTGVKLSRYALLGTDDEAIIIENIPRDRLLSLYEDGSGVLCNSNEITQAYACAITTKIMYSIEPCTHIQRKKDHAGDKPFCTALNKYINYCFSDKVSMSKTAEKKTLIKMANTLGKIEYARRKNDTITEYNFFTLFMPFYNFVKLYADTEGRADAYYEFLTYFYICTQNYDKPDRVFLQTADFNLRYFEMQTKYFTLYSAYIYRFKRLLNGQGTGKYEFILCPGLSVKTEVKEFHNRVNDKCRLFEVGIPETRMYDIKSMLCILGHEVAHFVGTEIRSRENRYEHMLGINSRIIILMFRSSFAYIEYDDCILKSDIWDEYEEKFKEWISLYLERTYTAEYWIDRGDREEDTISVVNQYVDKWKKHRYYTENVRNEFEWAIRDMLRLQGMDIFDEIVWMIADHKYMQEKIEYSEKKKYIKKCRVGISEIIDAFTAEIIDKTEAFNIANVLDIEIYLLKECYADLIAILSLRLGLTEYLHILIKEILNIGYNLDKLQNTVIEARIAIVMSVMSYTDEKSIDYFRWTDKDISDTLENSDILKLQKSALEFMMYIANPDLGYDPRYLICDSVNIIYDYKILRHIISHLLYCRQQFYTVTDAKKQEEVLAFKDVAACMGADEFYQKFMGLIVEYEHDIYAELPNITKEINERIQEDQADDKDGKRRKSCNH